MSPRSCVTGATDDQAQEPAGQLVNCAARSPNREQNTRSSDINGGVTFPPGELTAV